MRAALRVLSALVIVVFSLAPVAVFVIIWRLS